MKIQGQNEEMLLAACEQFLSKSDDEIQQVIEGNLLVNDGYDEDDEEHLSDVTMVRDDTY